MRADPGHGISGVRRAAGLHHELRNRLLALPGVTHVESTSWLRFTNTTGAASDRVQVEGEPLAVASLLLGLTGVYGIVSYSVRLRTPNPTKRSGSKRLSKIEWFVAECVADRNRLPPALRPRYGFEALSNVSLTVWRRLAVGEGPNPWIVALEPYLPGAVEEVTRLHGGDESEVLRLRGTGFDLVLHALPPWTTKERIDWIHAVANHVHETVAEVVTPLPIGLAFHRQVSGRTLVLTRHVAGDHLDRARAAYRASAARVLARIHKATAEWDGAPKEVPIRGGPARPAVPGELRDDALTAWWTSAQGTLVRAVTHGDYYRGNLICEADRVVCVVDWYEACVQPLLMELAAATFEMCRDDKHSLNVSLARSFVAEYRSSGGPIPQHEYADLFRAMRVWVRRDVLTSIAYSGGSLTEYAARQMRAFDQLRAQESIELDPRR